MSVSSNKISAWLLPLLAAAVLGTVTGGCAAKKPRRTQEGPPPVSAPAKKRDVTAPPVGILPPSESPGARPGTKAAVERPRYSDRIIRVLFSGPAKSIALDGSPVRVWKEDGTLLSESGGSLVLTAEGNRIRVGGLQAGGSLDVGSVAPFTVAGRKLPAGRVRVMNRQGKLLAVAALPLEEYVAAVLSREASPSFQPAALAALAVVVRTYAVNGAAKPRDPAFDLLNGVDDQVFDGFDRVFPQFRAAAEETRGVLLWFGDGPARANYHSTCGGRTESAADAWGRPYSYLVSVPCDDCRESPAYRWEYRMTLEEGRRVAQALGLRGRDDLRIEVVARSATGRASRIMLSSAGVTRETAAPLFRQAAGTTKVKSLLFEIERAGTGWKISGKGYGHGVGMCQWGAEGKARRGISWSGILAHYYPGSSLAGAVP